MQPNNQALYTLPGSPVTSIAHRRAPRILTKNLARR